MCCELVLLRQYMSAVHDKRKRSSDMSETIQEDSFENNAMLGELGGGERGT
jgi:hypothetical protein